MTRSLPIALRPWHRPEPVYAVRVEDEETLYALGESVPAEVVTAEIWKVRTAHGFVAADMGDYLVTDGNGDWWPVRRDIFESRYLEGPRMSERRPSGNDFPDVLYFRGPRETDEQRAARLAPGQPCPHDSCEVCGAEVPHVRP